MQRPAVLDIRSGDISAGEDEVAGWLIEASEEFRDFFGGVLEVGIHDHPAVGAGVGEPAEDGGGQAALPLAHDELHGEARGELRDDLGGFVVGVVIDDDEFPGHAGVVEGVKEAPGEGGEVGGFVEGGDDDRDGGRGGGHGVHHIGRGGNCMADAGFGLTAPDGVGT